MTQYERFHELVADKITALAHLAEQSTLIDQSYYEQYDVKRGLRDVGGNGVLAGLTEISDIIAFERDEAGRKVPCEGRLYYRGINIEDLVAGFVREDRFGFEETAYLLLFGQLPTAQELAAFRHILSGFASLPMSFVRDIIMKAPSVDIMNVLSRSVLTLYAYDEQADDIAIPNVLRQCLQLIAQFPLLSIYGYQVFRHYHDDDSLIIHHPNPRLTIAENMLHLLRKDSVYSVLEAKLLDLCLILHAEHGGGNNSSFTTHVVSSTATDTYSVVAASLGSLKGPRHGGANIKVVRMFEDMKASLPTRDDGAIRDYLNRLLDKEAFDRSGLIYGMGHAVYSLSDPRAIILGRFVEQLALEKGLEAEYELYAKVGRLAPEVIMEKRKIYKGVSANVDFYSGFVYSMLGIPIELFTPLFAVSRSVGWSAHRIEELANNGKIIRPGYISVAKPTPYVPLSERL
ncbi:MAG: citrate/2-methylcitrate synthase [Eubacteriales bacterium]